MLCANISLYLFIYLFLTGDFCEFVIVLLVYHLM